MFWAWQCKNKTKKQKVAEKREYDMEYRRKNRQLLKVKKQMYFEKTYDPVKAAEERKLKMSRHVEYCRRPEYKAWKREYDQIYRVKQNYGVFWESFIVLTDIEREVFLSPGASKPATYGRFKTSHDCWGFLVHRLTLAGSTFCSKYQTPTGLLFRVGIASFGLAI